MLNSGFYFPPRSSPTPHNPPRPRKVAGLLGGIHPRFFVSLSRLRHTAPPTPTRTLPHHSQQACGPVQTSLSIQWALFPDMINELYMFCISAIPKFTQLWGALWTQNWFG